MTPDSFVGSMEVFFPTHMKASEGEKVCSVMNGIGSTMVEEVINVGHVDLQGGEKVSEHSHAKTIFSLLVREKEHFLYQHLQDLLCAPTVETFLDQGNL